MKDKNKAFTVSTNEDGYIEMKDPNRNKRIVKTIFKAMAAISGLGGGKEVIDEGQELNKMGLNKNWYNEWFHFTNKKEAADFLTALCVLFKHDMGKGGFCD